MANRLHELQELGQSVWYDNIRRSMLTSCEFDELINAGILGLTSNPTIFDKAVSGSTDYDESFKAYLDQGLDLHSIYEHIILEDIAAAADLMLPVYRQTDGLDGYISLEVRPTLANDTEGTIREARHLFNTLQRPNIMIKVPATEEGIPAIRALIAAGININITLMFSLAHYEAVTEAYLSGLEDRLEAGEDISRVASVASFFVSRVDTAVDRALDKVGNASLKGKIAIANAKMAYLRFGQIFAGERWEKLAAAGARVQRPLWASTSTKNPSYPDTLYIDSLIGPQTVNTVPPAALNAFLDHGLVARTLEADLDLARKQLHELVELRINLDSITQKLQEDGVASFAESFESLMETISQKMKKLNTESSNLSFNLGSFQDSVDKALKEIDAERVVNRIWAHDHTVWKPQPEEIKNRLGWLNIAEVTRTSLPDIEQLVTNLIQEGYRQAILLGMGGSSLAPEILRKTFGVKAGYLDLAVLDSTDPDAIAAHERNLDLAKTVFIVSTKSGTTVETLSFFKYFYNRVAHQLGQENAGAHFIAITDVGTHLDELASQYNFRAIFHNDANIGGRYSALSYFGMVPAAMVGIELGTLLDSAQTMARKGGVSGRSLENEGAVLGAILGELAKAGRDKATFILSPEIDSFGDWVEQLIAESTGKEGRGILPVVGEPLAEPDLYGADRLFIHMKLLDDHTHDARVAALEEAGHPVVRISLNDRYDVGGQFFLWEMATAVAGHRLGINPFDQPNVESSKKLARQMLAAYQAEGKLPEPQSTVQADGITVYSDPQLAAEKFETPQQALHRFLADVPPGSYISLQAYLQPTAESDKVLQDLRVRLRDLTHLATTLGYGPRFLHSTGQLHKGDAGNGFFIQITSDTSQDLPIPDDAGSSESAINFGVLKMAQALGDRQALIDGHRRILRFHLLRDDPNLIKQLAYAEVLS